MPRFHFLTILFAALALATSAQANELQRLLQKTSSLGDTITAAFDDLDDQVAALEIAEGRLDRALEDAHGQDLMYELVHIARAADDAHDALMQVSDDLVDARNMHDWLLDKAAELNAIPLDEALLYQGRRLDDAEDELVLAMRDHALLQERILRLIEG